MFYDLVLHSRNRKVGPIPVAYSDARSCPPSCVLLRNGCYARHGPIGWHWQQVSSGRIGTGFTAFCRRVAEEIGLRRLWRYGVAGDLPGIGDEIQPDEMAQLVSANHRRPVIAYTHKPVLAGPYAASNRQAIADANRRGFLVNLSADAPAHADRLAELGLASVVTILPVAYGRRKRRIGPGRTAWAETIGEYRDRIAALPTRTPSGRRIAVCPATYSRTNCAECRACARPREAVIGFPAHGAQAKKAERAHLAARDVPVGWPWVFTEHRSLAEIPAEEDGPAAA